MTWTEYGAAFIAITIGMLQSNSTRAQSGGAPDLGPPVLVSIPGETTPSGHAAVFTPLIYGTPFGETVELSRYFLPTSTFPGVYELYVDGRRYYETRDEIEGQPGQFVGLLRDIRVSSGPIWYLADTYSPANGPATYLMRGHRGTIAQERPVGAPGFAPGERYVAFLDWDSSGSTSALVRARTVDPATSVYRECLFRVETDPHGNLVAETNVLERGAPLPGGGAEVITINRIASSSDGRSAAVLNVHPGGPGGHILWIDGNVVLTGGATIPGTGSHVSDIWDCAVNASGDWAAVVDLATGEHLVLRNGAVVFRGDSGVPGLRVSQIGAFRLTDHGDVYFVPTFFPNPNPVPTGIWFNSEPLIQPGVTRVEGRLVYSASQHLGGLDDVVDPSGTHLFFTATFDFGTPQQVNNMRVVLPIDLADTYCQALPHSGGGEPSLGIYGSRLPSFGRTTAFARHLPANVASVLMASRQTGSLPGAGGALGTLCLQGSILRSRPRMTADDGAIEFHLTNDFVSPSVFQPGETWHFQLWYRDTDPATVSAVTRFGDAVRLTFQ